MKGVSVRRWVSVCILLLSAVLFSVGDCMAGSIVQVTNTGSIGVLSDLVVYGAGGLMKTILKPGDASDDINIPIGSSRLFDAGFEVTSYVISKTVAGSESETVLFDVKQLRPQRISFATGAGGAVLALRIDFDSGLLNPGPNPITFTNGTAASLPGWTVGTGVDFTTGNITGLFTGSVLIGSPEFAVATVPEPSSYVLFGICIALFGWRWRRRTGTRCSA